MWTLFVSQRQLQRDLSLCCRRCNEPGKTPFWEEMELTMDNEAPVQPLGIIFSAKKYFLSVSKCCTHHIDLDWTEARHISSIYLPPIKWRIESCEHCSILLEFARNKLRNQSFLVSKDWTGFQLFSLEFWWNKVIIRKIIFQLSYLKRL